MPRPCYGTQEEFCCATSAGNHTRASGSGGAAACSQLQFQASRDGAAKHGLSKRTCAMRLAGLLCASLLCALGRGAAAACEGDSCPEDQAAAHRDHLLGAAAPSCPRVRKYPQDGSKLKPVRLALALRATSVCRLQPRVQLLPGRSGHLSTACGPRPSRERTCARRWIWRRRCWTCGGPARRRRQTGRAPRGKLGVGSLRAPARRISRADAGGAWRAVCVCADAAVGPVAGRARLAVERLWPHGELGGRDRHVARCGLAPSGLQSFTSPLAQLAQASSLLHCWVGLALQI
jgi:hypothetical protein